ncbi:TauD/TfdA-like domain-containing protein [Bordetella tumbae]|uniref:TauD/TfdA family dioxygenase n=1 Tax=Bordetella tumbae TaxID=1649139 RepID=UPI0039EF4A1B
MIEAITQPRGWNRTDLEQDSSWIYRLTSDDIAQLRGALSHALASGRSKMEMSRDDFPINEALRRKLKDLIASTQTEHGFKLMRGFPVGDYSEEELRIFYWGLGLQLGVPRPQGKASAFMSDVRDAGGTYRAKTGRGYNTSSRLDFHADGSDMVGLLVVRVAKSGGESMISSSIRAHNEMLAMRPDLVHVLYQPFVFSRQGEHAPEEPPYYEAPIFGMQDGHFVCRHIRNHINSAQLSFPEVPRLTPLQIEALDMLDATLARPDLCFSMNFEPGDLQFINNHIVLHARTEYEDEQEPERKRFLLRLWLALPEGQPLPEGLRAAYKDVAPKSVRGGFRGVNVTPEVQAFEQRIASEHGMRFDIYRDRQRYAEGSIHQTSA